jgi:hypothetical protein
MHLAAACVALAALVAVRADPPATTPALAPFTRDAEGRGVEGQVVADTGRPRVQRVAILPDRTTGRAWGIPYLEAAVADLNVARPDAVFTVGDMVQGYTRSAERYEAEVDEYLGVVGALRGMRFYPTAGNHDVISGTRAAGDDAFVQRYRARFGPLWYAVDLDLATAIVLFSDDALDGRTIRLAPTQLAWLEAELPRAAARGKPIFLLMHRPMWRSRSSGWDTQVQPLLERAGVDAVIAGHFHSMQRDPDVGGVQYHILGTCGGMIDQPPLAGQLQHLTFVDCTEDGALRVWHQPVGLVLPEDFVLRVDQDRVHALRNPDPAVRASGNVPDPKSIARPTPARATLAVRNPTDVPITVTLDPPGVVEGRDGRIAWWTSGLGGLAGAAPGAGSNGWTSHTLADTDNAHTMARESRAVVRTARGALQASVPPKGEATVEVPVTVLPKADAMLPPQLDVYATFIDSKGRTVPVYLPTRLPIERRVALPGSRDQASPMPVLAWDYSPYDTREANPTVRLWIEGDALVAEVEVPDANLTGAPAWEVPDAARRRDPIADAVSVTIESRDPAGQLLDEAFHWEPFTPGATLDGGGRAEVRRRDDGGWTAWLRLPLRGRTVERLQVGVADNDETYHTQWRWLAPGGRGGSWQAGPAGAAAEGTAP